MTASSLSSSSNDSNSISLPVVVGLAGCILVILVVLSSLYYLLFRLRKEHINAPVTFDHIYKQDQQKNNRRNNNNNNNNFDTDLDNVSVVSSQRSTVPVNQRIVNPLGQKSNSSRSPRGNNNNNISAKASSSAEGTNGNHNTSNSSTKSPAGSGRNNNNAQLGSLQEEEIIDENVVSAPDSARLSELTQQTSTLVEPFSSSSPTSNSSRTDNNGTDNAAPMSPSAAAVATIKKVKKTAAGKANGKTTFDVKDKGHAESHNNIKSKPTNNSTSSSSLQDPQSPRQLLHASTPVHIHSPDSRRIDERQIYTDSLPYPVSAVDDYRAQRQYFPFNDNYGYGGGSDGDNNPSSDYFYQYPAPSTQPRSTGGGQQSFRPYR
jgi:hypothetical protein